MRLCGSSHIKQSKFTITLHTNDDYDDILRLLLLSHASIQNRNKENTVDRYVESRRNNALKQFYLPQYQPKLHIQHSKSTLYAFDKLNQSIYEFLDYKSSKIN